MQYYTWLKNVFEFKRSFSQKEPHNVLRIPIDIIMVSPLALVLSYQCSGKFTVLCRINSNTYFLGSHTWSFILFLHYIWSWYNKITSSCARQHSEYPDIKQYKGQLLWPGIHVVQVVYIMLINDSYRLIKRWINLSWSISLFYGFCLSCKRALLA